MVGTIPSNVPFPATIPIPDRVPRSPRFLHLLHFRDHLARFSLGFPLMASFCPSASFCSLQSFWRPHICWLGKHITPHTWPSHCQAGCVHNWQLAHSRTGARLQPFPNRPIYSRRQRLQNVSRSPRTLLQVLASGRRMLSGCFGSSRLLQLVLLSASTHMVS